MTILSEPDLVVWSFYPGAVDCSEKVKVHTAKIFDLKEM
jgi:hypothetical protein